MAIDTRAKNEVVDRDFAGLSQPEQIRHFELEGYVILPGVLNESELRRITTELTDLPMRGSFYSPERIFGAKPPHWHSRACGELIGHPPVARFLRALLGEDVVFTHGHYMISKPGPNSLPFHADYKPYGSTYSRWEESCPVRVRTMYYLGDSSTLRILPRSHLSFHANAHPYRRYASHPDAVTVHMHAGSALLFSVKLFHATGPDMARTSDSGLLEYDYRPLWAHPIMPVEEWDPALVEAAPDVAKPFLRSPNSVDKAWEFAPFETEDVATPGLSPHRWER